MSTFDNDAGEFRIRGRVPLFPHDAGSDPRSIRFVTFAVLHKNVEFCCREEFAADEVRCWDDVYRLMGPGLYRALGKDEHHRVVAVYPPREVGWVEIRAGLEPCRFPSEDQRSSVAVFVPHPLDARSVAAAVSRSETARIEMATKELTAALAALRDGAPIALGKADMELLRRAQTALSSSDLVGALAETVLSVTESSSTSEPASTFAELTRLMNEVQSIIGEQKAIREPTPPTPDEARTSNGLPKSADKPHPLFPQGGIEHRGIRRITFLKLGLDGAIEECPNQFAPGEIRDWAAVRTLLGVGCYRAIARDADGCIVAEYPSSEAGWMMVAPWEAQVHKPGAWTNALVLALRHAKK
jgi:hypothetical protein